MSHQTEVIGHRGVRSICPENTLPSFEYAVELGVDAIEFDVRRTRDGHLVICHDATVATCSDGPGIIGEMDLAELRKLDFGIRRGLEFKGTRIPTLAETLDLIWQKNSDMRILVELKDDSEDCTRAVAAELKRRGGLERVMVLTFHTRQLNLTRELLPGVKLQGFPYRYLHTVPELFRHIDKTCLWRRDLNAAEIAAYHLSGIAVDTVPVDTADELDEALKFDIDSITTNAPDVIIPELKRRGLR